MRPRLSRDPHLDDVIENLDGLLQTRLSELAEQPHPFPLPANGAREIIGVRLRAAQDCRAWFVYEEISVAVGKEREVVAFLRTNREQLLFLKFAFRTGTLPPSFWTLFRRIASFGF
jgi:hypothetical protein